MPLVVSVLEEIELQGEPGIRLAWKTGGWTPGFILHSERVQELRPQEDGTVEYVCWETYYGVLAGGMRHLYGKQIREGYSAWMDGLKSFSEAEWERQTSPGTTPPPPGSAR